MEKKIKFTDKPGAGKIIYGIVIALLCITAIVVGIVAANNRKAPAEIPNGDNNGDVTPENPDEKPGGNGNGNENGDNKGNAEDKLTFISPVVGTVITEHSLTVPVFSETLEEWRVHTGIDISCEEGADVFCVADGEVVEIFSHPMLGFTVVLKHSETVKSVYSNLDAKSTSLPKVGDKLKSGDKIGKVGDSSLSELAKEPHLHFEVYAGDASVNPMDYFSDEAKKASLGINDDAESAA